MFGVTLEKRDKTIHIGSAFTRETPQRTSIVYTKKRNEHGEICNNPKTAKVRR